MIMIYEVQQWKFTMTITGYFIKHGKEYKI